MSSQVKKFSHRKLRDKKHQHFSTVSLPTDSVIVDHPVYSINKPCTFVFINIQVRIQRHSSLNTFKLATMLPFPSHNVTLIEINLS
jgi:hypothetical protein